MEISMKAKFIFITLIFFCTAYGQSLKSAKTYADLLFVNAEIYTVDAVKSWAEAMAIKDGKIIYIGSLHEAKKYQTKLTKMIDCEGRFIMPAFYDLHCHILQAVLDEERYIKIQSSTLEGTIQKIKEGIIRQKNNSWITGAGYLPELFGDKGPDKTLLDSLIPDKPAFFFDVGYHNFWVNSRALQLANITKKTTYKDHDDWIVKDKVTGEPTGWIKEDARELITHLVPKPNYLQADLKSTFSRVAETLAENGIVSVQDPSSFDINLLKLYHSADSMGLIRSFNVSFGLPYLIQNDALSLDERLSGLIKLSKKYQSQNVKTKTVKLFIDGTLESKTAAVLEPYLNTMERGTLLYDSLQLKIIIQKLDSAGFQLHFHAIGDRAIRASLDGIEYAIHINGNNFRRHQIAHVNLPSPDDIPRFRKLSVIANMQLWWMDNSTYYTELLPSIIGNKRVQQLHPFKSFSNQGCILSIGSDYPVTSLNPFEAIQKAITRKDIDSKEEHVIGEKEYLDLPETIAAYTIGGAYAQFMEKEAGSLEVGKWADFILLDKNLFTIDPKEIHKTKLLKTFYRGKQVFSK
jgi:predicted amidohydrolase YtcJ